MTYRESRIVASAPSDHPDMMACEVARLLAPYDIAAIDTGTVLEATATFMLDIGVYHAAHRFALVCVGFANGFMEIEPRDCSTQEWFGYSVGLSSRVVYDGIRDEEPAK